MILRTCVFPCLLAVMLLATGCAGSNTQGSAEAPVDAAKCDATYAYAPAAYIINIVSGDAVILDPMSNDFYVFCTPESAQKNLEKRIAKRELPQGDWKIYRVYGTWMELATEIAPNEYLLNVPAPIVDWVN